MTFRKSVFARSAYSELQLVGSRWTRILAKSPMQNVGPPHVQASLATPSITIIPTLHVASLKFYDRVLEYMQLAVRRNPSTVILLEGICDSEEAEKQQMAEYLQIADSAELKDAMLERANSNKLFSPAVMREICAELALNYDTLQKYESTVRLQECYLKPKMAALCGRNLRNNADLDMREVQRLLEEEAARREAAGESLPASVSVSEIGKFPSIRKQRERKVAEMARMQCERWAEEEIEGEVIVPWGYYHTEAITHYVLEGNAEVASESDGKDEHKNDSAPVDKAKKGSSAAPDAGHGAATKAPSGSTPSDAPARPKLVFVEADEIIAKVLFGVPKEIFDDDSVEDEKAKG